MANKTAKMVLYKKTDTSTPIIAWHGHEVLVNSKFPEAHIDVEYTPDQIYYKPFIYINGTKQTVAKIKSSDFRGSGKCSISHDAYTPSYSKPTSQTDNNTSYHYNIPTGESYVVEGTTTPVLDKYIDYIFYSGCRFITAIQSVTVPTASSASYVYNGSARSLSIPTSDKYTITGNSGTNVGEYTVTVALVDTTRYKWSDNTNAPKTYTITITPAKVTIPPADTEKYSYTGSVITYYIPANTNYTVSGNKQTNIGSYTVTVALKDKLNYTWTDNTTADKTYPFNIGRAKIAIPPSDDEVYIYDGSLITYNIPADSRYTISGNKQTNAGTYTVTVALKDPTMYEWEDGTTTNKTYTFIINAGETYYTGETLVDSNSIRIIGGIADNSNFMTDDYFGSSNTKTKPSSTFQALTDNNNTVAYYDVANQQPPLIVFEPNGFYLRSGFDWGYQGCYTNNKGQWMYAPTAQFWKIGITSNSSRNIKGVCEEVASQSIYDENAKKSIDLYKITNKDTITYCSWYITYDNMGFNKGPFQCSFGIPIANLTYKSKYDATKSLGALNTDIAAQNCNIVNFKSGLDYTIDKRLAKFRGSDSKYILAFVQISNDVLDEYRAKVNDPRESGGGGWGGYDTSIVNGGWGSYAFYLYFGNGGISTHGVLNTYHPCCYLINSCWTSVASSGHGDTSISENNQSAYNPDGSNTSSASYTFYKSRLGRVNPVWPAAGLATGDTLDYMKNANGTNTTTTLNCNSNHYLYNKPTAGEWYVVYISAEGTTSTSGNTLTCTNSNDYTGHYNITTTERFNTDVLRYTKATQEEINQYISNRTFDTKAYYIPIRPDKITFKISVPSGSSISADQAKVIKSKSEFIAEGFTFNDTTQKYTQPTDSPYFITIPSNETWVNVETGKTFYPGNKLNYVKYSGLRFVLK